MVLAQQTLKHSKLDTAALLALRIHFFKCWILLVAFKICTAFGEGQAKNRC